MAMLPVLVHAQDVLFDASGRRMALDERIMNDQVSVDHVARIGSYNYKIFVDRGVWPIAVSAILTEESRLRQSDYKDARVFAADVARHRKLVIAYMNSLRGTMPEPTKITDDVEGEDVSLSTTITGCEKYFPKPDRMRTHILGNSDEEITIDQYGRPTDFFVKFSGLKPPIPTIRDKPCQTKVGKWGIKNDDGGHMIGVQLGGYARRANIVPQNLNLNRGMWAQMQDQVYTCAANGYKTNHQVTPYYKDKDEGVRPLEFRVLTYAWRIAAPYFYDGSWLPSIDNEPTSADTKMSIQKLIVDLQKFCTLSCVPGADLACKA